MMTEQFKQFKIGELFTVTSGKWLSKVDQKPGKTPFISSSAKNNGIMTYINKKPLFPANTITVASHGSVGATFFQTVPYYASSNVNSLSYKNGNLSEKVGLYFVAAIQHVSKNYGFSHILSVTRTKQMEIMLPVTPMDEPDFEYMTMRIRELEAERIRELEAYLRVTGLDDTTLSASEAQALTQKVQWKKFRIGDIFEKADAKFKGKRIDVQHDVSKVKSEEFDLPVVSVLSDHNGVMYYGRSSEWTSVSNSIDIVQNGVKATGCVFYQPEATSSFRDAYLVKFKGCELTPEQSLYMVGSLKTVLPKAFSREQLATWTRVQDAVIQLPVTPAGDIDFDYIQNYIRATEKQTIKGVVEYKDRVVEGTKKIMNG